MKFKCENIGMISSADIEINKISVIAGLNSTGKSTIGKAFYCMFNGFSDIENEIKRNLQESLSLQINAVLNPDFLFTTNDSVESYIKSLLLHRKDIDLDLVRKIAVQNLPEELLNKITDEFCQLVINILRIPDEILKLNIVQRTFNQEFKGQLQNVFQIEKNSIVSLTVKNVLTDIEISQNRIKKINNEIDIKSEAFYIDNPFIIDLISPMSSLLWSVIEKSKDYRSVLLNAIRPDKQEQQNVIDEILVNEKVKEIEEKLESVSNGSLTTDKVKGIVYHLNDKNVDLSLSNVSAGLKTFVIIKALLKNGALKENGVLILDEPEIHLHPEWQRLFAEIIVLIQKTFNMHILISSHSPYFINALDVYERKYGINEECRFYLTIPDGEANKVEDVSKNLEPIYKLLFEPMQALENERASLS